MAIEYGSVPYAQTVSTLAQQAGATIRKEKAVDFALKQAQLLRAKEQMQMDFELAKERTAMDWQIQKAKLSAQNDFAHQMRLHQAELDREARAKEWEVEKMEMRSRLDFEKAEKERQQKIAQAQSRLEALNKSVERGEFQKDDPRIVSQRMRYEDMIATGEEGPASLYKPLYSTSDTKDIQGALQAIDYLRTTNPAEYQRQAAQIQLRESGYPTTIASPRTKTAFDAEVSVLKDLAGDVLDTMGYAEAQTQARKTAEEAGLDYDALVQERMGGQVPSTNSNNVPTAEELRRQNTREAYERGVQLGYWR